MNNQKVGALIALLPKKLCVVEICISDGCCHRIVFCIGDCDGVAAALYHANNVKKSCSREQDFLFIVILN